MIPYSIYKIIHLLGILTVFLSLGGMILHVINGGGRDYRWRNPVLITYGVGILLALLGGFGLMARIGIDWPWPGWVVGKFAIWLILGALPAIVIRKSSWAKSFWWGGLILGEAQPISQGRSHSERQSGKGEPKEWLALGENAILTITSLP